MGKKKIKQKTISGSPRSFTNLSLIILFALALLAYSNTFKVPFHFDDELMIEKRPEVRDFGTYSQPAFWFNVNNRPLSFFSFALNYQVGGFSVRGYHMVNFLVHLLASFVVYFLARLVFRLARPGSPPNPRKHDLMALFTALVFLLHPLQTMAVTYTVQRMTSMTALFYLMSVYFYALGRMAFIHDAWTRKSIVLIALAVISGLMALLSKQTAATLPIAILLFEYFFIRKADGKHFRKYLTTAVSLLAAAFLLVAFLGALPRETGEIGRFQYLLSQFKVLLHYGRLLLIPAGQNVDHGISVSSSLGFMEAMGLFLFLALIVLAVMLYKRQKVISFGILWFFICMAVESSIIPIKDLMMEHRLYLPMFGFALAVVSGTDELLRRQRAIYFKLALGAICLLLLVLTYARNETWKSPVKLWTSSLKHRPENPRALGNLGYAYVRLKDYDNAMAAYNRSIELDSSLFMNYMNRGIAYFDLGKYDLAISDFNRYLQFDQKTDIPFFFRGVSYAHLNQNDKAIADLDQALRINPDLAETHRNRGLVYQKMKNFPAALADFNKAISVDPNNKSLLVNRSAVYYMMGDYEKALRDVNEARKYGMQIDPMYVKEIEKMIR